MTINNNFKVLSDGSIESKNAKFSGNITGSNISGGTITGSTITGGIINGSTINGSNLHIKYSNGDDKLAINPDGLILYCPDIPTYEYGKISFCKKSDEVFVELSSRELFITGYRSQTDY